MAVSYICGDFVVNKSLVEARDNFIESAGRTTQGFGLGRIIGQLYALLFFSPRPLSLDEMAEELSVSKGSVSTNIRELEKWGAVKQVWVKGSRKDFYEAEVDFMRILKNGVLPYLRRKFDSSLITASESRELITNNYKQLDDGDKEVAEFYSRRLALIDRTQKKLSLLLKLPGF